MVRHFNNGARLQHAANNWQQLPQGVQRAVDKVANSVKTSPLSDEALQNKIQREADSFSYNLQCLVSDHVVSKYAATTCALAHLDPQDRDQEDIFATVREEGISLINF